MYDRLMDVIREEEIWVDSKHQFLLTPDCFSITEKQVTDLHVMGKAIHECLEGIGRIAVVAGDDKLARLQGLKNFNKALWTGIPTQFKAFTTQKPSSVPLTLKVDLMLTHDGQFKIGEIDAYNERSLGYCELTAQLRATVNPNGKTFPGVANLLAAQIKKLQFSEALLIYAEKERFYLPEFKILARALSRYGIILHIGAETEFTIEDDQLFCRGERIDTSLIFYYPFLHRNQFLDDWMSSKTMKGDIKFLIPPKPFLGNKTVLALLRNDLKDPQTEAILQTFVPEEALTTIRTFLPQSLLLKEGQPIPGEGRFILKRAVSSGAKGIYFPDDHQYYMALQAASKTDSVHILQEEVLTRQIRVRYYEDRTTMNSAYCYLRLNAYYVGRILADMAVTATQGKLVHGGTNSIFMGVVIT